MRLSVRLALVFSLFGLAIAGGLLTHHVRVIRRDAYAREETMVATILLEPCTPLRKSKMSASAMTIISCKGIAYMRFTTISAITFAASSPRSAALLKWR